MQAAYVKIQKDLVITADRSVIRITLLYLKVIFMCLSLCQSLRVFLTLLLLLV